MFGAPSRYGMSNKSYRDIEIAARCEGATPHGLVMMLFEELLKSFDTLRAAERNGEGHRQGGVQARAVSILHGLEDGLDHGRGGDIAGTLGRVYREARRLLVTPHGADRLPALDRARAMMADITGAWGAIG